MKVQAKAGATFLALDDGDAGEGLAIFFSQDADTPTRWRVDVSAELDTGADLLVGSFYVSPPSATPLPGPLTRQVAAVVCPGAVNWSVMVQPAIGSLYSENSVVDITLASSKCCTAPVGVTRVNQRYAVIGSEVTPQHYHDVLPGQVITGIAAFGLTGGGSVNIDTNLVLGYKLTVPAGVGMNLTPGAPIAYPTRIFFKNCTSVIEYLESA